MSCLFDSVHELLLRMGVVFRNSHELRQYIVQQMHTDLSLPTPAVNKQIHVSGRCDKCDATDHHTENCPWFSKPREAETAESRVKISEWLKMVSGDMHMTPGMYITRMGHASTWGGALELALISMIFGVEILVYRGQRIVSHFACMETSPRAKFVLNWTGCHYTPIHCELNHNFRRV